MALPSTHLVIMLCFARALWATLGAADAPVRVLTLGDSFTAGNPPGEAGYRLRLQELLDADGKTWDFIGNMADGPSTMRDRDHAGGQGASIATINRNLTAMLGPTPPDVILLLAGYNDYKEAPGASMRGYGVLLDRIAKQAPTTLVLAATLTPVTSTDGGRDAIVRTINAELAGLIDAKAAAGQRVALVDLQACIGDEFLQADRWHPVRGGFRRMGERFFRALQAGIPAKGNRPPRITSASIDPVGPGCAAIQVAASDPDGQVTTVEVFADGCRVGALGKVGSGWSATLKDLPGGISQWQVRATDDRACDIGLPVAPTKPIAVVPLAGSMNSGLLAHWTFAEGAGYRVLDHSGSGRHLSLDGDWTWIADGAVGGPAGNPSRLLVGPPLHLGLAWTISMRVRWSELAEDYARLVDGANGRLQIYLARAKNGGAPMLGAVVPTAAKRAEIKGATIPRDRWCSIALVSDGSTVSLYVDGRATSAAIVPALPENLGPIAFASSIAGAIDDVRIHDRALSAAELNGLKQ